MGDLNSMQSAKLSEVDNRTLKVPETDTQVGSNLDIPIDSERAGKFLAFDSNGKPIVAAGTSANLGPVSTFINDLLDDADAATARVTLDAQRDLLDTLTADNDILVRNSGAIGRLAIGSNSQALQVVSGASTWAEVPLPQNYMDGFDLSNASGDTDHDIDVAAGACAGSTGNIVSSTTTTIQIDVSSDRVDGSTLDADTNYDVLIGVNGGSFIAGFSKVDSLPSGWSTYRRKGTIRTDGISNIVNDQFGLVIQGAEVFEATRVLSGLGQDFFSLPTNLKEILVSFYNVSTSGAENPRFQIGDSTGVKTSGYIGVRSDIDGSEVLNVTTVGWVPKTSWSAVSIGHGHLLITNVTGNTWTGTQSVGLSNVLAQGLCVVSGSLTGTLDRLRFDAGSGVDTFDNGTINIRATSWPR